MISCYKALMGALWLFTILLAPACTISPSQSPSPGIGPELTLTQQLQNKLDSTRELFEIKGVSAAVIMPNNKTWLGVSGMSDPTIEKRIVPEMLFDIGSIGKNYLATLILKLVEEGTLTLEDPLRNWISSYPNIDNNITIRQLLNHTSGIYDFVKHAHSPFQVTYKSTKIWSQEEILVELVDKPYFPPGKGWHYSTTNYVLLRMIAEKAMGSKVSPEIENRFLIPLGLNSTVAVDPLEAIPRDLLIANNWIGDFVDLATKPQPWTATSPDLIYATAEDAARWMHLLYHEKKVLNRKSLDQMLDFYSPTPNEPPLSGYGLGVMFVDYELAEESFGVKGVRMWGHGGSTHGFRAIVMYLPDQEATISVLVNESDDAGLTNIFAGLLRIVASNFSNN